MATITNKPIANMVQSMRKIRDDINNEIKDMSFAEERAYLDDLLKNGNKLSIPKDGVGQIKSSINTAL